MSYPIVDRRGLRALEELSKSPWALPGSWLYAAGAETFRRLHDARWLPTQRLDLPVISIGSMTVGGSGKTPFVRWVARALRGRRWHPGIASRGYLGNGAGPRVVEASRADVRRDGDEPVLLARTLPDVPVLVARDRASLGGIAREHGVDVLLLDDGFQHRRLCRDLDVVLWDVSAERSRGRLLPRGSLREHPSALARASVVVLVDRGDGFPALPSKLAAHSVFRARLETSCSQALPEGAAVHALSGVADPESFERGLAKLGLRVTGATRHADHHVFSREEIFSAAARAKEEGADALAVTAKDHVRWPSDECRELPVPLVFDADVVLEEGESFLAVVESTLKGRTA